MTLAKLDNDLMGELLKSRRFQDSIQILNKILFIDFASSFSHICFL